MLEPRLTRLIAAAGVLLILVVMWDAMMKPRRRTSPQPAVLDSLVRVTSESTPASAPASLVAAHPEPLSASQGAAAAAGPATPGNGGPGYIELLARAETRRRIRASASLTYLSQIVAASGDSMLHRWDDRAYRPVRVFLGPATTANFQPVFLDAVRQAFRRWEESGIPVRFDLDADSAAAEVYFTWKIQFEIDRSGQTDLTWDESGRLQSGFVTLATFDPKGRPMQTDDVRVVALHEIGHLLGLDHSPDSTDIMFPVAKVRDLSSRDVSTAQLLYQLVPGSLR
ncbi:MAG: matrixin family metalloprotease [Gemmatimonadales bacterium]